MKKKNSSSKVIAILGGTGKEGKGLAYRLASAGYEIYIGSRSLERAQIAVNDLISKVDGIARIYGATYMEAVCHSEIIILSVPYFAHREILDSIKDGMKGKLLIDVTVPISKGYIGRVQIPPAGSAAQEALLILGEKADICTAFQNISYRIFSDLTNCECDVLVTGTSEEARNNTVELVANAGFKGWDAGPIENSIVVEGLTSLLIHINKKYHTTHAGIKITGV